MSGQQAVAGHTPGPWRLSTLDIDDIVRGEYGAGGVYVATVQFSRGDIPDSEVEANARLIAAGPELLAAAILVLTSFDHPSEAKYEYAIACLKIAVAKTVADCLCKYAIDQQPGEPIVHDRRCRLAEGHNS